MGVPQDCEVSLWSEKTALALGAHDGPSFWQARGPSLPARPFVGGRRAVRPDLASRGTGASSRMAESIGARLAPSRSGRSRDRALCPRLGLLGRWHPASL